MKPHLRRLTGCLLALLLLATSCTNGEDGPDEEATPTPGDTGSASASGATDRDATLDIRLSAGDSLVQPVSAMTVVDGEPMTDDEISSVLGRLESWDLPDDDREDFNRPADSLRPPTGADIIETVFPPRSTSDGGPDADSGDEADGPLEVVRYQPDGDVASAPFLSVTFNQAMVPVGTLEQLDQADVPVTVTPALEGRWRWIGTRTLRFEVEPGVTDRLPMATTYTVEIPAGTESATGSALSDDLSWTFTTPAPSVTTFVPDGNNSLPTEPVFLAVFDQVVEPDAVLGTVTLTVDGDDTPIRLATDDEVAADDLVAVPAVRALDGRAVAFRAIDPLPADAAVTITVGPGTPSGEGPATSTEAQTFDGRTHPALTVIESGCYGERPDACRPGQAFFVRLSNPLDLERFDPSLISVEPEIPGFAVAAYGDRMEARGVTAGNADYTLTLPADLVDVFGQRLGDDTEVRFEVGDAIPMLSALEQQFVTVDPSSTSPSIPVVTINHDEVRVRAWGVEPEQYRSFVRYQEQFWSDTTPGDPDWPQVLDTTVEITGDPNAMTETAVDLSQAFDQADGQLVVRIDPTLDLDPNTEAFWMNRPRVAWVQQTGIGVDAIVDGDQMLIWTTDLATGAPRPDVELDLLGGPGLTSDADGLATYRFGSPIAGIVASSGDDRGFLPAQYGETWTAQRGWTDTRAYLLNDRGIYKPGDTVRMAGWLRDIDLSGDLDLPAQPEGTWRAFDAQGSELADGTITLNDLGGFNLSFDVPAGANLGPAYWEAQFGSDNNARWASTDFQIQEFRTPEFSVSARAESPGPYYYAEPATVAVDASYYAGGPLPDAEVGWTVFSTTASYSPPSWDDYTFGLWVPWWIEGVGGEFAYRPSGFNEPGAFGFQPGGFDCFDCGPGSEVKQFRGRTDSDGTHLLQMDFASPTPDQPSTVLAEATVTDVNRQAWTGRTEVLVHPARYYVGLRVDQIFVPQGTPFTVAAVVTDVDGTAVPGRSVEIEAGRLTDVYENGSWTQNVVDPVSCTLTSVVPDDSTDAATCDLATDQGGTYRITATVTDDDGRTQRSELTRWVNGPVPVQDRRVGQDQVTIVPDQPEYQPGDTARLLVQAPFGSASGLVTVHQGGIVSSSSFDAPDGSAVVEIPIDDDAIPNLMVQVDMAGSAPRTGADGSVVDGAPARPAFATGQVSLAVPPGSRTLGVAVEPAADSLVPGSDTTVTVSVTDPNGAAVEGAQVAVVVVDEAVLSLTNRPFVDPVSFFYQPGWMQGFTQYLRTSLLLADPQNLGNGGLREQAEGDEEDAMAEVGMALADSPAATRTTSTTAPDRAAGMAAYDAGGTDPANAALDGNRDLRGYDSGPSISARTDFDPVAVFAPDEVTGPDGTVTVEVELPDNLTRYRAMAVAVDGVDRFGSGDAILTARLPIMVRPSAPRFLNFGDRFEFPVVIQNQTDSPATVEVAIEGANLQFNIDDALESTADPDAEPAPTVDGRSSAGRRITVPPNDRVEVRFPAAADEAGTARFRVAAVSADSGQDGAAAEADRGADAAVGELPVYTPATSEAFATYGTVDGGDAVVQPVLRPDGVFPGFGGLEVSTSTTAVAALTDAVLYLSDYRYDMVDGYASRILSIAALRDVLDAFDADGLPAPAALNRRVNDDIAALVARQNGDGGWSWWRRGEPSVPFASIEAAHALVVADEAGYRVPSEAKTRALFYLTDIENRIPPDYDDATRNMLTAYAINVRHQGGDSDAGAAADLYRAAGDDLELDALAWLWPVVDGAGIEAEIGRRFNNRAVDTAGATTFAVEYGEGDYLVAHSDRRADGIILDSLIQMEPDSELIPKVVNGLLGSRVQGRWRNVSENTFILLALNRYFDTFESVEPDLVARAWLGDQYVLEHEYQGYDTEATETLVAMRDLVAGDPDGDGGAATTDVVVGNDGLGRLYYRLGLRYAPDDLTLPARDEGFVVDRSYEPVDDDGDVVRGADGTWSIRAGATVRVRLTMVADARRNQVALIDPLPAGLEPLNPALAVTATPLPQDLYPENLTPEEMDEMLASGELAVEDGSMGDAIMPFDTVPFDTVPFDSMPFDPCWCGVWYQHQNLRDDRAEAYAPYLDGGTYEYVYLARATTPGTFVVPPTRAEEVYSPEVFGRSAGDIVSVN